METALSNVALAILLWPEITIVRYYTSVAAIVRYYTSVAAIVRYYTSLAAIVTFYTSVAAIVKYYTSVAAIVRFLTRNNIVTYSFRFFPECIIENHHFQFKM